MDPKSGVKGNDKYPNDTKFVWKDGNPDLTKPGIVTKKVTVTVPGMKAKEVEVTINVLPNPAGQDQVTLQGQTPDPKKSVADHDKYPKGTTFNSVSYTHLTLPTIQLSCRSRWSPYH